MRLQHVSVPVLREGFERARAFYGGTLGLREKPPPPALADDVVWFAAGTGELEVHLFADDERAHPRQHFCLEVDDLDAMRARLARGGHDVRETTPIENRPRFFCSDPFGNRVELTTILGPYA
jgi:catechol 2,3-dioxygenase-like lactoylglutathione lyase family enzyme